MGPKVLPSHSWRCTEFWDDMSSGLHFRASRRALEQKEASYRMDETRWGARLKKGKGLNRYRQKTHQTTREG